MTVDLGPLMGLKIVTLKVYADDRGFFCERFKFSDFDKLGLPTNFLQDNFSRSQPGVVRGLHYQWEKPQGKLVTCLSGRILDVAVDIRFGSPTFGKHMTIELNGDKPQWFWIPAGFAHGFSVLGNQPADVFYRCDYEYNPKSEDGINWQDPDLKISWNTEKPILSPKDERLQSFKEYASNPRFFWKNEN